MDKVVDLGDKIKQKRVLVTGTSIERFRGRGEIIHSPMIKIEPVRNLHRLDAVIHQINQYDWILFTSKYAVRHFLERFKKRKKNLSTLREKVIIAIGKTTAKWLTDFGLTATHISKEESAQGILQMLKKVPLKGKRILIPRSNLANNFLVDELRGCGARIETVTVYRNTKAESAKQDLRKIDEVIFTSPSTVKNFFEVYQDIPESISIKAIGPVTQASLKDYGKEAEVI